MTNKEQWKTKSGFVLAAAGSAVGLGNLWGFAYRASEGGGGAFILLYLIIVLIVCLPLLIGEMVLGRYTRMSPVNAPVAIAGSTWKPLGWLFCLVSVGILSYYLVLMGYTASTIIFTFTGNLPVNIENINPFFEKITTGWISVFGQISSLIITGLVVLLGVRKGIEKLTRFGVPLLLIMLIGLAIWAAFQPGASEGYDFLFKWDYNQISNPKIIANAFRQAFFSIGTGIGAILAYSNYLKSKSNIPGEATAVVTIDTVVALIAGCVTFPMISIFSLEKPTSAGAVGVLFKALPHGLAKTDTIVGCIDLILFKTSIISCVKPNFFFGERLFP